MKHKKNKSLNDKEFVGFDELIIDDELIEEDCIVRNCNVYKL